MEDTDRALLAEIVTTPFVSSWLDRARPGDRHDKDPGRRSAAWAQHALSKLARYVGSGDRSYIALTLDGQFHDLRGKPVTGQPHLEIPGWVWDKEDPKFPDRLAQVGNGIDFPWWVVAEVTATRRALFNTKRGDPAEAFEFLNVRKDALVQAHTALCAAAQPHWGTFEQLLAAATDGLASDTSGDFTAADVAEFLPGATALNLSVVFDQKLHDSEKRWVSRRVGVWQICGTDGDGHDFSFGVLTPRLTANSQFHDPLFVADRESAAALLVRGLLLRRLSVTHLGGDRIGVSDPGPARRQSHLRAVVAREGSATPQASMRSAVAFLQTFPSADDAWTALTDWAAKTKTLLTVREDTFKQAHANASRHLKRAEDPARVDVNVVLPVGFDNRRRAIRVTFSNSESD